MRQVWVTICEIEPGLFQAIYSNTGSPSKEAALPSYYSGAGTDDARRWFERSARALGFGEVIWIDVSAADLIRAHRGRIGYRPDAKSFMVRGRWGDVSRQ